MRIDKTLENDLFDNGIYEAWQFIINTSNTIQVAGYCRKAISRLIYTMQQEHESWKDELFKQLFSQDSKVKRVSVTTDSLPENKVSIVGEDVSVSFLLNKLTKDFFQYCRNTFDSISQIANVALLASKAKAPDSVDFPAMLKAFNQHTYSQDFPAMHEWYNAIDADNAFKYIDAFNNRTKHTYDIYLKLSMDFLGDNHSTNINPFFRKDEQHDKKDVEVYLSEIFKFVCNSFDSFLDALATEYPKKVHLENRYNNLKAAQQKMSQDPKSDYAVAYIESTDTIDVMPNEIFVLLLSKSSDGTIYSKNCSIDTILVKKQGANFEYIGRYIADTPCGDDTLLRYRKYRKDSLIGKDAFIQTVIERKDRIFFKANPFMDISTTTDDKEFLQRIQLPF